MGFQAKVLLKKLFAAPNFRRTLLYGQPLFGFWFRDLAFPQQTSACVMFALFWAFVTSYLQCFSLEKQMPRSMRRNTLRPCRSFDIQRGF